MSTHEELDTETPSCIDEISLQAIHSAGNSSSSPEKDTPSKSQKYESSRLGPDEAFRRDPFGRYRSVYGVSGAGRQFIPMSSPSSSPLRIIPLRIRSATSFRSGVPSHPICPLGDARFEENVNSASSARLYPSLIAGLIWVSALGILSILGSSGGSSLPSLSPT